MKSTYKRHVASLLVSSAFVLTAAACGSSKSSTATTAAANTTGGATTVAPAATSAATIAGTTAVTTSAAGGAATTAGQGTAAATPAPAAPTGDPIKIGLIVSLSGPVAPTLAHGVDGAQAKIDLQNSKGGLYGRPLQLVVADDASTADGVRTAAQDLVENKKVSSVMSMSFFTSVVAQYLHDKNMPVYSQPYSGAVWGKQPFTNMFGTTGGLDPTSPSFETYGNYWKKTGATKIAVLGLNSSSSDANAKIAAASAKNAGLQVVYQGLNLPLDQSDFTTIVLALKQSGADGMWSAMGQFNNVGLLKSMAQAGLTMKGAIMGSGYGRQLLDDPTTAKAAAGVSFTSLFAPYEGTTPAAQEFRDALAKVGIKNTPNFDEVQGYMDVTLAIAGFKAGGQNFTSQSIIDGLRKVSNYDGDGMGLVLQDYTSNFGKGLGASLTGSDNCFLAMTPKDGKWVEQFPDPICGKEIPNSAQTP